MSSGKETFSILIVDDDPVAIQALRRMLDKFTPIRFATSCAAALKLARDAMPDLVLLDVELPDMSGFELCKQLKADPVHADCAVVFLTANLDDSLRAQCLQLGAVDVMKKPGNASLLEAIVRSQQRVQTRLSDTIRSARAIDFLTGCRTRISFEKSMEREWLRARRARSPMALMLVDILDFKVCNEQHGEAVADGWLQQVAEVLRTLVRRPSDVLARYAGGQFAALLPDTPDTGVKSLAERICAAVGMLRPKAGANPTADSIRVACGVCVVDWSSIEEFIHVPFDSVISDLTDRDVIKTAECALVMARSRPGMCVAIEYLRRESLESSRFGNSAGGS